MEMSIRFPGLGLVFDYVPRSFQIFGMEFTIYGVLIAVGALLGMGLVTLEAKRNWGRSEQVSRYDAYLPAGFSGRFQIILCGFFMGIL